MTATIDKRIVEMSFKNDEFEKGVGTSLGTIDKLKKSLNFDKIGNGFAGITAAANKVNFSWLLDGISATESAFIGLGFVAINALTKIVDSAVNFGFMISKALTIDPISAGLTEYETKLNSIQTILANTQKEGTTLDTVTDALNQLNEYSDKTIYNFQQMTRNVGTFTAAGVDLKTSVEAIKGIANLAAISGSNADQASTAMYQLSQALSSGSVKLMDWNSVLNAGMGGQVFQDAIMETARLHGVGIDEMIASEGSFRETLQKGWFTSEILTETLAKFTGDLNEEQLRTMGYTEEQIVGIIKMGQTANDAATKVKTFSQLFNTLKESAQSGWAQTWEIILGDFEEAKIFFTEANTLIGGMIGVSADARNSFLQGWKDLGGRESLIASVRNAFESVLLVIKPIKDALREIFPPITSQRLFEITKSFQKLTESFKIGEKSAETIKRIFKGVFALFDIGRLVIISLAKHIGVLTTGLGPAAGGLFEFVARIGDFIVNIRDAIVGGENFSASISKIVAPLLLIRDSFKSFIKEVLDRLSNFKGINLDWLITIIDNLKNKFKPLTTITNNFGKFFILLRQAFIKIAPIALELAGIVSKAFGNFLDKLSESLTKFQPERIIDIINGGLLGGILLSIKKFISKGSGVFGGLSGILDTVKGSLEAWQTSLKADVLLKIGLAIGVMALSIFLLSSIDESKLKNALIAMTVMFTQLGVSLAAFQTVSATTNPIQMTSMAIGLIGIASAMLIMALAVHKLGTMEPRELVEGMLAIVSMIGIFSLAATVLSKSSLQMIIGAAALIVFSFAIRSLAEAVLVLGQMDSAALTKGLIGVGVLITEIALFMKTMDVGGLALGNILGVLVLAVAISILAKSVEKLSEINGEDLAKALTAIGVILTELSIFVYATAGGATLLLTAAGIAVIAVAMIALTEVMERLGALSWDEIGRGLTAMAGALVLIGAASYLLPPTMIVQAAGLVVMAAALILLGDAMTTMGSMTWDEIGRGITVLSLSLLILAFAMHAMTGSIAGAASLFIAALALMALAPPLKILGSMSWEEIGRGLVALSGLLIILGIAGSVLTPVVPTLFLLGAAGVLLGLGLALAGVGLLAFSAGLAALAVTGSAGVGALVIIISSIIGLVPMIVATLGRAILALIDVLVQGAPTLLAGIVTLLTILLDGLIQIIPKVINVIVLLVEELLTTVAKKTPLFVKLGYEILIGFLSGVRDNIGEVASIAYDIAINFINAIAEKLPELIDAGYDFIIKFIDGLASAVEENIPRLMSSVRKLGIAIVKGILEGLLGARKDLLNGIAELGTMLLEEFKESLGIHSPSDEFEDASEDIINGLVSGVKKFAYRVYDSVNGMADQTVSQFSTVASRLAESLNGNMDLNPTITPVIDFSNIDRASSKIDGIFGNTNLNATVAVDTSQSIASALQRKNDGISSPSEKELTTNGDGGVQFVQNNYSPKALSNIEIYRNTRNLLSKTIKPAGAK